MAITIPANDTFRAHLMIAFLYMITCFNQRRHLPDFGIDAVLDEQELVQLKDKLLYAEQDKSFEITFEELLVVYASVNLMIKLLVSEYDEMIFDNLLAELPEDVFHEHEKQAGSFSNFRNNVIQANVHIIRDTEEKFKDLEQLQEFKAKLDNIHIG